ncbi:hypothetical protein BDW59DRAFT_169207 [Aspergillus cavernicola]|uniref:F-box domain-containing protein n=1 Tax=Aspergillus cavernicola TaxID=176166 RepID=A0ABR4IZF0_9EURO
MTITFQSLPLEPTCLSFVQRLSIEGFIPAAKYNDNIEDPDLPGPAQRSCPGEDEWTDLGTRHSNVLPSSNIIPIDIDEMAPWIPLSEFTRKLSGLRDLLWIAWTHCPPSLLDVLRHDLPNCRLHLRASTFNHLYSTVHLPNIRMGNIQNAAVYTERAITQLAAGLAPNLTHVYMHYNNPSPLVYDETRQKPPRGHLFTERLSSLSHICSLGLHNPSLESIETWSKHTPFSNLTTLQLCGNYNYQLLVKLTTYKFSSLKNLVLCFKENIAPRCCYGVVAGLDKDPDSLLSRLPPLESLLITAPYAEQPLAIPFEHHGPILQKLGHVLSRPMRHPGRGTHIAPGLIKEIHAHYTKLRHLTIRIPRTQGNRDEVNLYRALHILPLSSLTLELDCTAIGKDPEPVLANLAIDESLVRSIFSTITGSDSSSLLLQTLRIEVFMSLTIGTVEIFYALMGETIWEVFCAPDGVFVHESLRDKRNSWRAKGPQRNDWMADVPSEKAFRELWPFPLQLE